MTNNDDPIDYEISKALTNLPEVATYLNELTSLEDIQCCVPDPRNMTDKPMDNLDGLERAIRNLKSLSACGKPVEKVTAKLQSIHLYTIAIKYPRVTKSSSPNLETCGKLPTLDGG